MKQIAVIFALFLLTSCGAINGILKNPAAMELLGDSEELIEKELEAPQKFDHTIPLIVCGSALILVILTISIWKLKFDEKETTIAQA